MASNVTDPKKRVIMFRFTDYCEIDFDEWYSHRKDAFKTEADALKRWVSMCDRVGDEIEVTDGDGSDSRDWDDYFETQFEEIEKGMDEREVVAGPPEPLVKGEDYEDYEEEEEEEEEEEKDPELIYNTIKDMKVNELTGTYYQTYGGGPEGGYYKTNERWYRLHRTWYETWRVTLSQDMHVLYENGEPSKIEPEHQILPPA